jgi:hypothetical protein
MVRLGGGNLLLPTVSAEEAKEFDANWKMGLPHCCTAETFRINIRGGPKSPWNRSAAQVFARSYLEHHQIEPNAVLLKDVADRAMIRIKSLRVEAGKKRLSAQKSIALERAGRRRGRKSTVSGYPQIIDIRR